jgi:hypothetical protein
VKGTRNRSRCDDTLVLPLRELLARVSERVEEYLAVVCAAGAPEMPDSTGVRLSVGTTFWIRAGPSSGSSTVVTVSRATY